MLLHDAVLEFLICGNTQIQANNLYTAVKKLGDSNPSSKTTGFEQEFKVN